MATEWDSQDYGRGIPPPIQLNDQSAVNWYHTKLEASRRLAERNPLAADQSYSLALTIPQSNLLPTARSVPPLLHSSTTSLRLDKPLQTGAGKLSQVWTAVVEGTRTTLVLKIIQPSMCRYPSPDRCWSEYMVPEDLARREAWAYEHFAHKQGLLVPYFFGLHTIDTPSGESAWVLVVEHIPGMTFAAHLDSPTKSFSDTCALMKLSIDAAMDFTSDGWLHLDLEPRNILITGSPGTRGIIFIDYCFVHRLSSSQMHLVPNGQQLYGSIMERLGFDSDFRRWAEANLPLASSDRRLASL